MKKLYMFDLDGVLIDSKKNMNMSWDIVKLEHKVEPTFEDYFKHVGKPFKTILTDIGTSPGVTVGRNLFLSVQKLTGPR